MIGPGVDAVDIYADLVAFLVPEVARRGQVRDMLLVSVVVLLFLLVFPCVPLEFCGACAVTAHGVLCGAGRVEAHRVL